MKLPFFHIKDFTGLLNSYSRRLVIGNLINSIGNGLTMSLFMVYLTTIRDFSTTFSGIALAWMAVVGLILNPIIGSAIDIFGARAVVITDRKSTRLNSSHTDISRMPSSA